MIFVALQIARSELGLWKNRNAFNLNVSVERQTLDTDAASPRLAQRKVPGQTAFDHLRSGGLDIAPVLRVDLVHGRIVGVEVGEEDVDLDNIVDGGAGSLKDGGEVLDALVLETPVSSQLVGLRNEPLTVRALTSPSTSFPVSGSTLLQV